MGARKPLDSPHARGWVKGLTDAQHVTIEAAYEANQLRDFIADDLGATAHIKRNPTRLADRYIDWALHTERHLVERFFNRIKRFRRIVLRCEKTGSSFKASVDLAGAMAWIA